MVAVGKATRLLIEQSERVREFESHPLRQKEIKCPIDHQGNEKIRSSSTVERWAVNPDVAGSNPACGAKKSNN